MTAPTTARAAWRAAIRTRRAAAPRLVRLVEEVVALQPYLADSIAAAEAVDPARFRSIGEHRLEIMDRAAPGGADWPAIARRFVRFSVEHLVLQRRLERTGRYDVRSSDEADERVYRNREVMEGYLDGIHVSLIFWPNHFRFLLFFLDRFLRRLEGAGPVVEAGIGHGAHAALLSRETGRPILGFDISPHALQYARRTAEAAGARVALSHADLRRGLPVRTGSAAGAICGEMIEHVEDPASVLRELRRALAPGAPLFVTTAAFAANVDHVHLFRSAADIRTLLRSSGLSVEEEVVLPVRPGGDPEARDVALNYAAICRSTGGPRRGVS